LTIGAGTGTSIGSWTGGTTDFFGAIGSFLIFGTDDITDSCMEGDGITAGTSLLFLISATCSSIIGAAAIIGSSSKTGTTLAIGASAIGASAIGATTTGSEGSEGTEATEGTDGRAGANGSLYTFVFEFDESVDSVDILFIVSYFIFFINSSFQKGKGLSIVLFYDT
jgi:uncharacterized protein (UPF0333 family)